MMTIVTETLAIYALSGFLFGQLVGIRIPALNQWKMKPLEQARLGLFFGLIYLCLGFLFGLAAAIIGISLHLFLGLSARVFTQACLTFCAVFVSYFFMKWTRLRSAFLRALSCLAKGAAALFIFFAVSYVYVRFFPFSLSVFLFLFTPLVYIFIRRSLEKKTARKGPAAESDARSFQGQSVEASAYDTKTKVLLLGIDAADWRMIDPLIEQGKLANLARLKKEGFHAQVDTLIPTASPQIWTSIATSKEPQDHGIIDWQKTVFPGFTPLTGEPSSLRYPKDCGAPKIVKWLLKRNIVKAAPSTSQSRTCKAFWNVFSDFGKRSATIGWLFSWPAEQVKGLSVSWYTYPFEEAANVLQRFSSAGLKQRTYPEELIDRIKGCVVRQNDLTEDELKALHIPTVKINYDKVRFADQISPWYLSKDKTFFNIASFVLDNYNDLDVTSVFFSGIDATSHTYWTFLNKDKRFERLRNQILSISDDPAFQQESRGFDRCIELYYQYTDGLIGKLLEKIDQDWTVMLVSDHGFRYDGTGHEQGCKGACILYGKNIRGSAERGTVSIYDLMPTLLALSGIPLAKDLKGRVIKEAIEEDFFEQYPLRYLDTYEDLNVRPKQESLDTPPEVEQGLTRRLRALGYID